MDFEVIRGLFGIDGDCGFTDAALEPVIARFGGVPAVLRDYYQRLGAHSELNQTQECLVVPDGSDAGHYHFSRYSDADGYLVFYVENQEVWLAAVAAADAALADPSVWQTYPISRDDYGQWHDTGCRVSQFLAGMAHVQRAFSIERSSEGFWELTPDQAQRVRHRYPSLGVDLDLYGGISFHARDAHEIIMLTSSADGGPVALFGADDEDRYGELEDDLADIMG
ncbi:MAG: hypothetical protein LBJ44_03390 [Propionibacteriaceae bacterium]|jgi:hypothetical protein|nr:hypothetical protein [Propionibacteriaceae bacterium]